jgi:hypothetical protein
MASAIFGAGCIVGIPIWAVWSTHRNREWPPRPDRYRQRPD